MKSINYIFLFACCLFLNSITAQIKIQHQKDFGEHIEEDNQSPTICLNEVERIKIKHRINKTIENMKHDGLFDRVFNKAVRSAPPLLQWPLRQANGFNDPGYYAISNYVDLDPTLNNVLDYNGLNQTYDGHNGVDIRVWPYWWKKKADSHVEAIAAADGIIIFKQDGNVDNNCSCTGSWNAVYLAHADGSVTWYGHLKQNTTTAKDSGDVVVVGEYLGIVGSSGCSTNPHLHLECYDNLGNRIEPFAGTSNTTTTSSWWANQLPYYDSGINKISTHSTAPTAPACPGIEVPNEKNYFDPGDAVTFSISIRHSITSDSAKLEVFEPDGTQSSILDLTYIRSNANGFFLRSVQPFWNRTFDNNDPLGKWRFKVTYYSQSYGTTITNHEFWLAQPCIANQVIAGTHVTNRYYQTSNTISSTADVSIGTHVVYDAENYTILSPGFVSPTGSKLEIKTNGCN